MTSYRDWVVETSSTTGTGAYALSGSAPAGTSYFTFRQRFANGEDEVVYWVVSADRTKWEKNRFGTLTYGSPDTLSRNVVESTNGDAPVSWVGGDTPLRIYVVPDAEAQEFAVSMGLGAARPGVLKFGIWADEDSVSANVHELKLFDGTSDITLGRVYASTHSVQLGQGATGQVVSTQSGVVATGTTQIPSDDTIPQNTEGDQYMSLSITPKSATSTLVIEGAGVWANGNNSGVLTAALFQDSTANALAVVGQHCSSADQMQTLKITHVMTSGTTSATTFKVRAGHNSAGTTTFNGSAAGQRYGGTMASVIVIREIPE